MSRRRRAGFFFTGGGGASKMAATIGGVREQKIGAYNIFNQV